MKPYRIIYTVAVLFFAAFCANAQVDRHDVRSGNRRFSKEKYREAEIDYRKALLKDTVSMAANYNLASTLYREENFEEAAKVLERIKEVAPLSERVSDYNYNAGDIALARKDYAAAVESFKQSLLANPGDLEAKENYIYAKKMLENQQNDGGGGNDDQNRNQNRNQDQNQNGNDNRDQEQQPQPQEQKLSSQQAQQMLKAVQVQEKKTQDKVNKEKAELLRSSQKEKNW